MYIGYKFISQIFKLGETKISHYVWVFSIPIIACNESVKLAFVIDTTISYGLSINQPTKVHFKANKT